VVRFLLEGIPVECAVDTGFSGAVLIPYPLFESAGLVSRILADRYKLVMPDLREVPALSALGNLTFGEARIRAKVHAAHGVSKKLVGRHFLEGIVATLDGPKKELTISFGRAL
jgi:predicted aspartyl protease